MPDGIQFNDEQDAQFNPARFSQNGSSGEGSRYSLIALVQKMDIVHSESQAQYLLATIGIVCILISGYIFLHNIFGIGNKNTKIHYNIAPELLATYPPDIQRKIKAANSTN
jgi:hypothetical protein